jgi:hypothetical protein
VTRKYILRDGEPVEESDLHAWGRWFETANEERTVARTELPGNVCVSTVFLGMDHGYEPDAAPVLWETLVFRGPLDQEMERYTSRAEAEAGHRAMVERVAKAVWDVRP